MDALLRAFRETPEAMKDALEPFIANTTVRVAQRMRATAPRATGLLRSSIHTAIKGLRGRVLIGVDAYYWPWVEYGTVKMQSRPFIRTAAELESLEFEDGLRRVAKGFEQDFYQRAA